MGRKFVQFTTSPAEAATTAAAAVAAAVVPALIATTMDIAMYTQEVIYVRFSK